MRSAPSSELQSFCRRMEWSRPQLRYLDIEMQLSIRNDLVRESELVELKFPESGCRDTEGKRR